MRNLSVIKGLYQGNGVTRRFAIPFEYNDKAQIFVTITTYDEGDYTYRVLDSTEYTIDEDSVEIVYPKTDDDAPIPSTQYLTVWRDTDLLQLMDLTNQGAAWPDSIEASLDKLHQIVQELAEGLSRALKVDIGDPQTPDEKLIAIQDYVLAAAESSRAAAQSEVNAKASEDAARQAATAANTYQIQAGAYAESAFGASAPAWDSTATYNYPQVVAYTDGKTYRCVGTNVTGGDVPGSSNKWVAITLDTDDFWDIDIDGGYMPSLSPMYSTSWEIDGNGDLEPKLAN